MVDNKINRMLGSFCLFELDLISGLSMAAKLTYTYLISHYNHKTRLCFPSIVTLSKEIGCNKGTVISSLKILEKEGLIVKSAKIGEVTNYIFTYIRHNDQFKRGNVTR